MNISRKGTKLLNSITDYLYWRSQQCHTIDEADPLKLALAICGAVRKGSPHPLTEASYEVFGRPLAAHWQHRMKEQFQQAQDLRRCINECPDVDKTVQVGAEAQRNGAVYQMQPAPPSQSDIVRKALAETTPVKQRTTG
jgi:hypothetical protein